MSLFGSWFPARPLRSNYELPLWNEEPLAQSAYPPPPIATSVYASPAPVAVRERAASTSDEMMVLHRRERDLQQTLQELLDAQAEGLLTGLGGTLMDETTLSNGSLTPRPLETRRSLSPAQQSLSPAPRFSRRRAGNRLGLRAARKEIWRAILECAAIKGEEDALLRADIAEDRAILRQLDAWEEKQIRLKNEIARIGSQDTKFKVEELKSSSLTLQGEINAAETKLMDMKIRHKAILAEIADLENRVQSEISSYEQSLQLLEADLQSFLTRPSAREASSRRMAKGSFLSLPPKRRTLIMAKEHWEADYNKLEQQRKIVQRDSVALEEGAVVWKRTVAEITSFERSLRQRMQQLYTLDTAHDTHEIGLQEIMSSMDSVITAVEEKLEIADSKNWKLLVVCIGAELEALHQGREILQQTVGALASNLGGSVGGVAVNPLEEPQVPEDGQREQNPHSAALHQSMYDTDEDPGPDLMVQKQDTDTD